MVDYKFMGRVPNSDITDYYRNHRIDCFITTSSSEGLPVSVMEAAGAGIPVIATDVGGMSEIVEDNGILLPGSPDVDQVADAIVSMATLDNESVKRMRRCSRDLWEGQFDAAKNAKNFSEYLMSLLQDNAQKENCSPRVILVTDGYPYGGEQSFIEPELREILKYFDVDIICLLSDKRYEENRGLAEEYINRLIKSSDTQHSLTVTRSDSTWYFRKYLKCILKYFFDKTINKERLSILDSGGRRGLRLWESMKCYACAEVFYRDILKDKIENADSENTIVYTYWHRYPTLAACLKKDRYKGIKIITREHGYDLYDERMGKSMRQPFRGVMDPLLDGIIFPSKKGRDYYLQRNNISESQGKYHVFYLGSASSGMYECSEKDDGSDPDDSFRMVSCSALIELKRVDMIIKGLKLAAEKLPDKQIQWIHFGDGYMMGDMQSLAGELLGHVK